MTVPDSGDRKGKCPGVEAWPVPLRNFRGAGVSALGQRLGGKRDGEGQARACRFQEELVV